MSLNKYVEVAKIEFLNSFAYFYELLAYGVFISIIIFVFFNMMTAVYRTSGNATVSGFSFASLMWFFSVSHAAVSTLGGRRIARRISEEVKSGEIAYSLNKPYNFILYNYAYHVGYAFLSVFTSFAAGAILLIFLIGLPSISLSIIPFVILSIIFSVTIDFLIYFLIGVSAFWFEDISAFLWIQQKLVFILGGMLLPLEFFPKFLQDIAINLPFAYIAYAPAKLFADFTPEFFMQTVLMQIFWITILAATAVVLYKIGSKKVSINGG